MIIIIHPGSLNLRVGRASDLHPHRILNAIARRRKPLGKVYRDTVLPGSVIKVRTVRIFTSVICYKLFLTTHILNA